MQNAMLSVTYWMTGCKNYFILNSNFAHKDSILLKNIQGFGIYRNIYETIQLPVRTLSLSVNRSGTKFAEKGISSLSADGFQYLP